MDWITSGVVPGAILILTTVTGWWLQKNQPSTLTVDLQATEAKRGKTLPPGAEHTPVSKAGWIIATTGGVLASVLMAGGQIIKANTEEKKTELVTKEEVKTLANKEDLEALGKRLEGRKVAPQAIDEAKLASLVAAKLKEEMVALAAAEKKDDKVALKDDGKDKVAKSSPEEYYAKVERVDDKTLKFPLIKDGEWGLALKEKSSGKLEAMILEKTVPGVSEEGDYLVYVAVNPIPSDARLFLVLNGKTQKSGPIPAVK